jgi:uncharacterized RDD family membrane protein YckC
MPDEVQTQVSKAMAGCLPSVFKLAAIPVRVVARRQQAWTASASAAPALTYANWGRRVGAYLIDVALPLIVVIILIEINVALGGVCFLLASGWAFYNRSYLGGRTGQSLGKKALSIRLVGEDTGQPIGVLVAWVRDLCHAVDMLICCVGFLFPLWDAKRQTLADKLVRTVVIPA